MINSSHVVQKIMTPWMRDLENGQKESKSSFIPCGEKNIQVSFPLKVWQQWWGIQRKNICTFRGHSLQVHSFFSKFNKMECLNLLINFSFKVNTQKEKQNKTDIYVTWKLLGQGDHQKTFFFFLIFVNECYWHFLH